MLRNFCFSCYSLADRFVGCRSRSSSSAEMWMRISVWAVPSGHVCELTFSTFRFPASPLSMIHRFLRPFSLHPIDGFQSYLNFKVLMHFSSGWSSALLTYRLYKVTVRGGGRGLGGGEGEAGAFIRMYCFTFSIHHKGDDSISVKIHWTQIKSDGCYHWKLKSCHAIIGTNDEHRDVGLRAS